ncbi:ParB N-terminal domain-containing protein, partial [Staphylococcus epidermidis]|uniref:ParB N-terminal domain-containing protein n=1 Tax=Staphylococcus epidermidis TaxID=1282 RepID=UPI001642B7EE
IEGMVGNGYEGREVFEGNKIKELGECIEEDGLLEGIVVGGIEEDMLEIIGGEGGFGALEWLDKGEVDVIVGDMDDEERAVVGLIEN